MYVASVTARFTFQYMNAELFPCLQRIREYGQQYERSLQEAREQSARVRRQIAMELRDATPLTDDYDDGLGKLPLLPSFFS